MHTLKLCTLLLTTSFLSYTEAELPTEVVQPNFEPTEIVLNNPVPTEKFQQCPQDDELKKAVAVLLDRAIKSEETLHVVLALLGQLQQEKIQLFQNHNQQIIQANMQAAQEEIDRETINNSPWYKRYPKKIETHLKPWIMNELTPVMRQLLTNFIAQLILKEGIKLTLKAPDAIFGDLPDKIAKKPVGYRPVEYWNLSKEARTEQAIKRELQHDPEYQANEQKINELKTTTMAHSIKAQQEQDLLTLSIAEIISKVAKEPNTNKLIQDINQSAIHQTPATYRDELKKLREQQVAKAMQSQIKNYDPKYKKNQEEIDLLRAELTADMLYAAQKKELDALNKFQKDGTLPTETPTVNLDVRLHDPRYPTPPADLTRQSKPSFVETVVEPSGTQAAK